MTARLTLAAIALALCVAPVQAQQAPPSAADSDPVKLGWMQGNPPPPEKQVRFDDGSYNKFPQTRWSFAHFRELVPTARVARGHGPVSPLPVALRPDVARLTFVPAGDSKPVSWVQAFDDIYTDAVIVLHRGRIVYEKYNGVMNRDQPHILFSLTKAFYGTLTELLIDEGKIDERQTVAHYLPELAQSGVGDATVRQVLDMTTSLDYNEDAADAGDKMARFGVAAGMYPAPPGYDGPRTVFDLLKEVRKVDAHGQRFDYQSVDTEVLGLIISRVTGQRSERVLQDRIWSRLGAENDAYMLIDRAGLPRAAGGLNTTLRDLARFAEMIRLKGRFNGQQIVPARVIAKMRAAGDPKLFAKAIWDYDTRRGFSYGSQWWHTNNANGALLGVGMYGQSIYIDPKAEMVAVKFMSNPDGSTVGYDRIALPAFAALAEHLKQVPAGKR